MTTSAVLDAVAYRLKAEPDRILPTLRLLADPDALPDRVDAGTINLAHAVNAQRLAERRAQFQARALPTSQVRALLGVTRQAVASRVANRRLLSLEIGGTSYFPDWQFGPDGVLPGAGRIVAALAEHTTSVLAADALMRAPLPEEGGRSPAQILADGDVDLALHYVAVAGSGF